MFKLLPVVFLLASFGLQAEIKELAPGLTIDTSRFVQKIAPCGAGIPGEMCIIQCYNVDNKTTDHYYTCNLQAKATFIEQINLTNGGVLYLPLSNSFSLL